MPTDEGIVAEPAALPALRIQVPPSIGFGNALKTYVALSRLWPRVMIEGAAYGSAIAPGVCAADAADSVAVAVDWRLLLTHDEAAAQRRLPGGCSGDRHGKTCPPIVRHLVDLSTTIDLNYDNARVADSTRASFVAAFKRVPFTAAVHELVARHAPFLGARRTLCVSVRTWKAPHERGVHRPYNAEAYEAAIKTEASRTQYANAVLAVDEDGVAPRYMELLAHKLQLPTLLLNNGRDRRCDAFPPSATPEQCAAAKALLLSAGATLIGSRESSFTEVVYWLSGCAIRVVPLF